MTALARPVQRVGWRDAFGVREFRGLFFATLASQIGDQLAKIALAILVYDRTHSSLTAALIYGVSYLPALLAGPLLGFVADTRPRRSVMMACDLVRAALVAVMLVPHLPTYGFLVLLFVVATFDSPFNAARAALLPDVLDGELYPVGQSINSVTQQVSQIIGFGVGGVVVATLTARGALGVDVASFLVSLALVGLFVRHRPVAAAPASDSRWLLITAGAREVLANPLQRNLIGVTAVSFSMIIATEGLAVSYAHQIGHGDAATGLLTAAVPVGSALGLVAIARVPDLHRIQAFRLLAVLWPLPLFATALRPPVAVTCALWALAGSVGAFQLIGNLLFAQGLSGVTRGRAFAFAQTVLIAVQGLGVVLAGAVAELTTPADSIAILALGGLALCGLMVLAIGRGDRLSTEVSSPVENSRYRTVATGPAIDRARVPHARAATSDRDTSLLAQLVGEGPANSDAVKGPAPGMTRTVVVYVVASAVFLAMCGTLFAFRQQRLPGTPLHVPWWLLLVLLTVIGQFRVPFQRGRDSFAVTPLQIPVLLGLFFSSPWELFVGVIAGGAITELLRRGNPLRFIVNRAVASAEAIVALAIFHSHPGFGGHIGMPRLLVGLAAMLVSDVAGAGVLALLRRAYDPAAALKTFVRPASFGAGVSLVTGSIGLLAVTAMYANSSSAALLIVIAIVLAGSIRSYAKLQERHASLGQLYAIQEQLGTLVPQAKSLFPVLEQARSLLQAERVVLTLLSDDGTQRVLSVHVDEGPSEAYEARTSEQLALTPPEALSVELRIQQARLGLLAVHGRLGRIRGFDRSDLKLLETLGAHVSDALERGTLVEKLREAATHDALTGLLTLGELMVQVDERLLRDTSLFVCLLDVSGLRDVNDSLGHEAGDALLRTLATRLTDALPPDALIARSGGGEFAVALREGDAYSSLSYVETLAEVSNGLVQVLDVTVELRTRCGWLLLPTDAADASTAIRRADLALAEAKRGLHPAARYRAELDVDGGRRLRLVSDLRRAIADRSLHVVYQPLVTPRDGRIIGAEALVRWNHPDLGPLSPDEFVGIAEHSGLIGDMTRLVLDEALAQVRQWHLRGQDVRVAVNLSARCLTDMSLPGAILDLLAHHRVAADHLTLEVTETSVAEEPVRALAVLERLRGIGVRLSIDDFGTGYSSLASLKRFPVQEVKLDRQFLLDVGEAGPVSGKSDWALIAAIVALGHSLDLEIVAEGVEDAGTYERLRDMGVDVLQGYYIGRPAPGVILPVALAPVMS